MHISVGVERHIFLPLITSIKNYITKIFFRWNVQDVTIDEAQNSTYNYVDKIASAPKSKNDTRLFDPCSNMQPNFKPLNQLTPYTRYAAYVKTYTTMQDKKGAQSAIIYFRTLPGSR